MKCRSHTEHQPHLTFTQVYWEFKETKIANQKFRRKLAKFKDYPSFQKENNCLGGYLIFFEFQKF